MPPRDEDLLLGQHIDDFLREHGGEPQMRAVGLLLQSQNQQNVAILRVVHEVKRGLDSAAERSDKRDEAAMRRLNEHEKLEIAEHERSNKRFMAEIAVIHDKLNAKDLAEAREAGAAEEREKGKAKGEKNIKLMLTFVTIAMGVAQAALTYIWNEQVTALKGLTAQVQKHEVRLGVIDNARRTGP